MRIYEQRAIETRTALEHSEDPVGLWNLAIKEATAAFMEATGETPDGRLEYEAISERGIILRSEPCLGVGFILPEGTWWIRVSA